MKKMQQRRQSDNMSEIVHISETEKNSPIEFNAKMGHRV